MLSSILNLAGVPDIVPAKTSRYALTHEVEEEVAQVEEGE